ncbi:helix-turn-helix transcriptional regulator [Paenibacillus humicus]|uniref:helix-turn-helix transcriptional regulator n=1 Tax=Paenibacillus humicus TaxID=412861 RepID=UPI000FD9CB72|nr:AraC family transcriptional regulator [Paenibacillus humicus]
MLAKTDIPCGRSRRVYGEEALAAGGSRRLYPFLQDEKELGHLETRDYRPFMLESLSERLYLYGLQVNNVRQGFTSLRHVHHRMVEVNLVLEGVQEVIAGKDSFLQHPGDFVLIHPGQIHEFRSAGSGSLTYAVFHLQCDDLGLTELLERKNKVLYSAGSSLALELAPKMDRLLNEAAEQGSRLAVLGEACAMMAAAEKSLRLEPDRQDYGREALAGRLAAEIEGALAQAWDGESGMPRIETLASRIGLSSRHAGRLFREVFHMSPGRYLAMLREQEAMRLLAATPAAVEEIAHAVGYRDVQSFSRPFRKWTGQSPSGFRRAAGEGAAHYLTPLSRRGMEG